MCIQSGEVTQKCAADGGAASNCQTGKNIGSGGVVGGGGEQLILLLLLRPMTELCYSDRRRRRRRRRCQHFTPQEPSMISIPAGKKPLSIGRL